jgi:hypothetical protein
MLPARGRKFESKNQKSVELVPAITLLSNTFKIIIHTIFYISNEDKNHQE